MQRNKTINEYIVSFPPEIQKLLQQVREIIHEEAPDATEAMVYGVPTFKLNGSNLVHFAAFKHHIGFFPTPSGIKQFKNELSSYKTSTGTIQFPFNVPLPLALIRKITKFRVAEVLGV